MKRILTLVLTAMFALGLAGCDLIGGNTGVDCVENPNDPSCLPEDNAPVISLNGDSTINLMVGETYVELEAMALDVEDGDISENVVINNSAVDTSTAGTYTVTYNVTDSDGNAATQITRTVIVGTDDIPVITLEGDLAITIFIGDTFTDPGYSATDTEDGTLTVVVGGDTVDTTTAGVYEITYNVTDSDGNAAVAKTRTVTVVSPGAPVITLTGATTINMTIGDTWTDPGYSATDPEDGTVTVTLGGDTVNTATAGTYVITYDAVDSDSNAATQVTRTVIVSPNALPVITLTGDATVNLTRGTAWTDPGATATDAEDDNATLTVVVGGDTVDVDTIGVYVITYNVTDSHGGHAVQVTRTVNVTLSAAEQAAVDYFMDNWDSANAPQFLGAIMLNMDFEDGQTFTTDFSFEVTEDIDEIHNLDVMIEDTFVYIHDDVATPDVDESRMTIQRYVDINMDDEFLFNFVVIFEEVETGVHVYLQPLDIISQLAPAEDPVHDIAAWVGFTNEWAVFEFDDSLSNIVEIQVLKDMIVGLFFAQVGETFFDDAQQELENQINFDLNQYGVDFGNFFDLVVNEDWTGLDIAINAIDEQSIILEVDYRYVAWQLYGFFNNNPFHDLTADPLFDETKLELLNTATCNEMTDEWGDTYCDGATLDRDVQTDLDPDGDPLTDDANVHGTQAFFNALTPAELDIVVESIIKPMIESSVYNMMLGNVDPDWLAWNFEDLIWNNEQFFIDNWPTESGAFDLNVEYQLALDLGTVEYWKQLTQAEKDTFWWLTDTLSYGGVVWGLQEAYEDQQDAQWFMIRFGEEIDYDQLRTDMYNFIDANRATLEADPHFIPTGDVDQMLVDVMDPTLDLGDWFEALDYGYRDALVTVKGQGNSDPYDWAMSVVERHWEYSWILTNYEMSLNDQWISDTLVQLIDNHRQYIIDNYGVDQAYLDGIVSTIGTDGGIDWYLYQSSENDRDFLRDVADFDASENWRWAIDNLEEVFEDHIDYHWYYGRMQEQWPEQEFRTQLINYLDYHYGELVGAPYNYNVDGWKDAVQYNDIYTWWDSLTQTEQENLLMVADNNWSDYDWAIYTLQGYNEKPWEYGRGFGTWNWVMEEQWIIDDMNDTISNNLQYLSDEYGIDGNVWLTELQTQHPVDWYMYTLNDDDRDVLRDLAEQGEFPRRILKTIEDIVRTEDELIGFLTVHELEIEEMYGDTTGTSTMVNDWITYIQTNGIVDFMYFEIDETDIELINEAVVYPFLLDLYAALDAPNFNTENWNPELLEFFLTEFFTNPHIAPHITNGIDIYDDQNNLVLSIDPAVLQLVSDNMMLIDWDQLLVELQAGAFDVNAFYTAVHDGDTAYTAYLAALELVDLDTTGLDPFYPDNLVLFLEMFAPAVLELMPYMTYVDDAIYAFEGLAEFQTYLDITYYMNTTMMNISNPVLTDEQYIQIGMEMTPIGYQLLLNDLAASIYTYLSGFTNLPIPVDSNWECITDVNDPNYDEDCVCDPLDTECQEPDEMISYIAAMLTQMGDLGIEIVFDPLDPTWMSFTLDLTDVMDVLVGLGYDDEIAWRLEEDPNFVLTNDSDIMTGVNNLTITITIDEFYDLTIPAPEDTDVVNDIAIEFGKFGVSMMAREIIREIGWQAERSMNQVAFWNALVGEHTFTELRQMSDNENSELHMYLSPAFDPNMSTLTVTLPIDPLEMPTIELELYWADGTAVFDAPLTLTDIESVFDANNDLLGATAYQTMIGWVNDTNYHPTKLLLLFAFQDHSNDDDMQDPNNQMPN